MREAVYDLLCASLLGLGNMCLFMGYDTQMTIVEPVLRSVHDRSPGQIDRHAGFYGAGLCTVFFMLASLVSPCVLGMIGSKKTLLLGSLLFTLHLGSFQCIHFLPYYSTAAAIGVGYALFYSGHGGYLTEHSTKDTIERNSALTWALATSSGYLTEHSAKETIERNSALTWALATSSTIAGGVVLALTAQRPTAAAGAAASADDLLSINATSLANDTSLNTTATLAMNLTANLLDEGGKSYREYSDGEIKIVYGAFTLVCLVGNLIFVLIPAKNVGNSISARFGKRRVGFVDEMKKLLDTFTDVQALHLVPIFCFIGLTTCFWVGAYPTTFVFSKALSGYTLLPALYLVGIGVGEILMGAVIWAGSKHVKNFAQLPSLFIGSLLFLIAMVLALLSTPPAATHSPTSDPSPLLEPSPVLVLLIALLLGASDNSFNTSRTVLCALILPENIAQVYSMSKFFQPLTSSVIFFIAPHLSMTAYFQICTFLCLLSLIFYWRAARATRREEKTKEDMTRALTY